MPKHSKHLQIILTKMCKMVGVSYDKVDFKKKDWFLKYSWTEKEQEKFRLWLAKYLLEHKEARDEIMEFPAKDKKDIERVTFWSVYTYGWKLKV